MKVQKANISKSINYLLRALIILLTYVFIYRQVFMERRLQDLKGFLSGIMERDHAWLLFALILTMMLINWSLESVKWRLLIGKIEKISFFRAFKAVMTGVSVSLFTPNRTGEYLGRVFILKKGNPVEGILITVIGSFAQIVVTFSVGLFCLLSFVDHYLRVPYEIGEYLFNSLVFLVPCLVFVLILMYFRVGLLADFVGRFVPEKWNRFRIYLEVFAKFESRELFKVLMLSVLRYMVFSTQFYLLLRIFGASLPVNEGFILIPVIYLIMAMVPTVALAELGIRGSVSMFVIGLYFSKFGDGSGNTDLIILAASSILWFINLALPAVLGTFFVFSLKFWRK
jgi:hypothetical protein